MARFVEFVDCDTLAEARSQLTTLAAVSTGGDLLLSGGSAARAVQWVGPRRAVWLADERWVPRDHEHSNHRQVQALAPTATVHGPAVPPAVTDRLAAAEAYSQQLPAHCPLAVLGVGPDGHIGSLFADESGHSETPSRNGWVTTACTSAFAVAERLSVTMTYLTERCGQVVLLLIGPSKADIWAQLQATGHTPAHQLLDSGQAVTVVWWRGEAPL